jgi:hypothetical protein
VVWSSQGDQCLGYTISRWANKTNRKREKECIQSDQPAWNPGGASATPQIRKVPVFDCAVALCTMQNALLVISNLTCLPVESGNCPLSNDLFQFLLLLYPGSCGSMKFGARASCTWGHSAVPKLRLDVFQVGGGLFSLGLSANSTPLIVCDKSQSHAVWKMHLKGLFSQVSSWGCSSSPFTGARVAVDRRTNTQGAYLGLWLLKSTIEVRIKTLNFMAPEKAGKWSMIANRVGNNSTPHFICQPL